MDAHYLVAGADAGMEVGSRLGMGNWVCGQEMCDGDILRAGGCVKASNVVGLVPVCLSYNGIATMHLRNCTSSAISGSFKLRSCGEAIETLSAGHYIIGEYTIPSIGDGTP